MNVQQALKEKISVILPTYNERQNILPMIEAIHSGLGPYEHEIIVVDDNSPDDTIHAVSERREPFVKTILRTEDRGLAKSILCGLEKARGDIIVVMDSDFNHQPAYLPSMVGLLRDCDCVFASRFVKGGSMYGRARRALSLGFNLFVRILTGIKIHDSTNGFFAAKRNALSAHDYGKIFYGFGDYCIRLAYYLQKNKTRLIEMPAVNAKRIYGRGNTRFIRNFLSYTLEVIKLSAKGRLGA